MHQLNCDLAKSSKIPVLNNAGPVKHLISTNKLNHALTSSSVRYKDAALPVTSISIPTKKPVSISHKHNDKISWSERPGNNDDDDDDARPKSYK